MESGAHALGCAVIAAGTGNTEQQLEAIAHFQPSGYVGTPDFLKICSMPRRKRAKTPPPSGGPSYRARPCRAPCARNWQPRGLAVCHCYATADLGVIAYESEAREGMIVNETLLVEIVAAGTGDPAALGEVGEVVVTAFNRTIR